MMSLEAQYFEPVITTLDQSGLDLSKCILHGSSVLALYNLRAAHDIDLFVEPAYFEEMAEAKQTPGGLALANEAAMSGRSGLRTVDRPAEGSLPMDMGAYSSSGIVKRLLFKYHSWKADDFESGIGTLPVLSLNDYRKLIASSPKPKHKQDVELINAYLGN